MENPLVSIIIPIYNAEKYLPHCLDSIIAQTYTNLEIICINDGSTDDSGRIILDYCSSDERISIISLKNGGVSNARNKGLDIANGEWVLFVDADDWLDGDCVERLLSVLDDDCDIVMFPYISERRGVSLKRDLFRGKQIFRNEDCKRLARRMIGPINREVNSPSNLDSYGTVWGKFYKHALLCDLKFKDLKEIGSAEDSLYNMFAFKRARTVLYCPDCYYHYRKNNESLTEGYIPNLKNKWRVLFSIISNHFTEDEELEALSNRIALGTLGLLINEIHSSNPQRGISDLLNDDLYNKNLRDLSTNNMPLHWKLFFFAARNRWKWLICGMLYAIHLVRSV